MNRRNNQICREARKYSSIKSRRLGFRCGARWADAHPNAVSMNYLHSWYQASVDETEEPIWTDKHLDELFKDFYLIPKTE